MSFNARIFALDPAEFQKYFLQASKPVSSQSPNICDEMLAECIRLCQVADWSDELETSLTAEITRDAGIGPDLEQINEHVRFLSIIQGDGTVASNDYPWWLRGVRPEVKVILTNPERLERFVDSLHEIKLLEVVLGNFWLGTHARKLVELCHFLDNARAKKTWLLTLRW